MENLSPDSFQNWLPYKLKINDNELLLEWLYLGDIAFVHPFFDETIAACRQQSSINLVHHEKRHTSLEFLIDVAQLITAVPPSLFIFHTSRCGSTLITQLLSLDEANIVVPEFELIDSILRLNEKKQIVPESTRKELLRSLIAIVGQRRKATQKRLIIKLDSCHFYFYKEIRTLFPESRMAILFRDPDSILNSVERKPGIQFVPELVDPRFFSLNDSDLPAYSVPGYANLVLAEMYKSIHELAIYDPTILLLDYNNGMKQNIALLSQLLDIPGDFLERDEVKSRFNYHAKQSTEHFKKEEVIQNKSITEPTLEAYQKICRYLKGG